MKRDMDLCREILLTVENLNQHTGSDAIASQLNRDETEVGYMCEILSEAGYMSAEPVGRSRDPEHQWHCMVHRLTWDGHEFVDSIRDSRRYEEAKKTLGKVKNWTFSMLNQVVTQIAVAAWQTQIGV